ncbi:MAG: YgaP family membrane protein [Croceimicrobium sp.]|nr:DUF2892 domain-containing protein [Bacteroidota bacterium]
MKKNMSSLDRIVRIVIAAIAAYLYIGEIVPSPWGMIALIAGGVLLATSVLNFCPLYRIFGISTCKV